MSYDGFRVSIPLMRTSTSDTTDTFHSVHNTPSLLMPAVIFGSKLVTTACLEILRCLQGTVLGVIQCEQESRVFDYWRGWGAKGVGEVCCTLQYCCLPTPYSKHPNYTLYIVHLKGYQHRRTRNDGEEEEEEEDSNFGDSTDDENEDEYYGKRSPARDAFRMPSAQQPSAKMPT